jgi:serine/threonine protein kinase
VRLSPGSSFGRYTIESRLGEGGMGIVYLASDSTLSRKVALKLLSPALAIDDFRSRFVAEARSAAALDHPHVLPVYEAGEYDGQLYLAMRYVPGFDLGTLIAREGALTLARTTLFLDQIAAALDAAHASGLVHRDVKPPNVLIAPGEHAYLADFGLARPTTPYTSGLTRAGQLVGSMDYLAPELIAGASASASSDIYALGCLVVECLTGAPPFRRDTELATLYAQVHDPVPQLGTLRPGPSLGLDAVVQRVLAKRPEDRHKSASEFAAAVASATSELATANVPAVASIRGDTGGGQSRARDSTVQIASTRRGHVRRLVLTSLASLLLFGSAAAALVANDLNRRVASQTTPAPTMLQSAEPTISPTPSAAATPKAPTLIAEELILPLGELPFTGYVVDIDRAWGRNGWVRQFRSVALAPKFPYDSVTIEIWPSADAAREYVDKWGSECVGPSVRTLTSPSVGDSSRVCVKLEKAPAASAVYLLTNAGSVSVLLMTVPLPILATDFPATDAAIQHLVEFAGPQVARINRIAP